MTRRLEQRRTRTSDYAPVLAGHGRRLPVLLLLTALPTVAACGSDTAAPTTGFEWPVVAPAEAGLDTARLRSMVAHIGADLPNLNALLIVRGGAVSFEWYTPRVAPGTAFDTRSVTKSFVAAFVGIALHRGWLTSLDQKVTEFYPDLLTDPDADPRIRDLTLRHLMTMSSGIEDEQTQRYTLDTADLVGKFLRLPLLFDPGTSWLYDGANPHIVSGVITKVSGSSLSELAYADLFPRLNIAEAYWINDTDGVSNGGTGLWLAPRDLAKLGELYLRDGVWQGERLMPPDFARQSAGTVSYALPNGFADYAQFWWTS
ncbi:MAG: beta-lactamase family protein, partial [Gemmatimonadota bacterium]|nr:beta-lactamase family protein [Gemmatimonadota bacterium]